ncbi:MAG: adenosylcobinamide-GDP ribazoletransferase [Eubacteriales bacterium]|nr:adenosylcobinamide-GDP ribazoletransferase [Eubacteriales bacterium]
MIKDIFVSLIVAFSMYSKIPMPHILWSDRSMRYAMCFFPWVGFVVGGLEYLFYRLCLLLGFGTLWTTAGMILLPILVTGGIHFDGFMDTSDAMSSWREREDRLRILKDSHVGAFAVIAAVVYFVAAFGAASEIRSEMIPVLCMMFGVTRSFSAISVVSFPHANPSGTAAAFGDHAVKKAVQAVSVLYIVLLTVVSILLHPVSGVLMIVTAVCAFLYYYRFSMKYFGGMTGDLAGNFVTKAELAILVVIVLGNGIVRVFL